MSVTPSARQRKLGLAILKAVNAGQTVVVEQHLGPPFIVGAVRHRLGIVYLQPKGTSSWLGMQHVNTFTLEGR